MIHTFTWAITVISLTGTILNVKKHTLCFWLWGFGNISWLSYDLWMHLYSRAVLDAVQLAFAIWGAIEWNQKSPSKRGANDGGKENLVTFQGRTRKRPFSSRSS